MADPFDDWAKHGTFPTAPPGKKLNAATQAAKDAAASVHGLAKAIVDLGLNAKMVGDSMKGVVGWLDATGVTCLVALLEKDGTDGKVPIATQLEILKHVKDPATRSWALLAMATFHTVHTFIETAKLIKLANANTKVQQSQLQLVTNFIIADHVGKTFADGSEQVIQIFLTKMLSQWDFIAAEVGIDYADLWRVAVETVILAHGLDVGPEINLDLAGVFPFVEPGSKKIGTIEVGSMGAKGTVWQLPHGTKYATPASSLDAAETAASIEETAKHVSKTDATVSDDLVDAFSTFSKAYSAADYTLTINGKSIDTGVIVDSTKFDLGSSTIKGGKVDLSKVDIMKLFGSKATGEAYAIPPIVGVTIDPNVAPSVTISYGPSGSKPVKMPTMAKGVHTKKKPKLVAMEDSEAASEFGPKSQKAKGILYAAQHVNGQTGLHPLKATLWRSGDGLPKFPIFARPCPMTPRHGFVDSRLCKDAKDWAELLADRAKSDEPQCEIILMAPMIGPCSSIITPTGIVVGPGNDGATSGHDSLSVPIAVDRQVLWGVLHGNNHGSVDTPLSHIGVVKAPFVETVTAPAGTTYVVQVRDGPEVELTGRWVPEEHLVTEVVEAGGDLLEWETTARELAKKMLTVKGADRTSGPVVWHPGGSMSSHYAVHCVINKVPIICKGEKPVEGVVLEPSGKVEGLSAGNYGTIAKSIAHHTRLVSAWVDHSRNGDEEFDEDVPEVKEIRDIARLGIAVLHSQHLWGGDEHLLVARGAGVAWLLALGQAACAGEGRHYSSVGPGGKGRAIHARMVPQGGNRGEIFNGAFRATAVDRAKTLKATFCDFMEPGWSGSYGGKKWADCARATMRLGRDATRFMATPSESTWLKCVESYNVMVNLVHNGGKFLNKFLPSHDFDFLAVCPSIGFVGKVPWGVLKTREEDLKGMDAKEIGELMNAYLLKKDENVVEMAGTVPILQVKKPPKLTFEPGKKPAEETPHQEEADHMPQAVEMLKSNGAPTDAQFKVPNTHFLHVQVPCAPPINREYGLAIDVPMSQVIGDVGLAEAKGAKNGSLTGSGTLYTLCQVYEKDGKMFVDVTLDGEKKTGATGG